MDDDSYFPSLSKSNLTSKDPPPITLPKAVGAVNIHYFDEWDVKLIGQYPFPTPKKIIVMDYNEN